MKRLLKVLGIAILLLTMAYASNWDLPKEDVTESHEYQKALEHYLEHRDDIHQITRDGVIIEGQLHPESVDMELVPGPLPQEYFEGVDEDADI